MVQIRIGGLVQALGTIDGLGAGAKQLHGPIATFGSVLPYAYGIETGRHRGGRRARAAGGAYMFREGIAETKQHARAQLVQAIKSGPGAIAAAKGRIRTFGIQAIRKRTPVRSGRLRASVSELNRPGIGTQ